MRNSKRNTHQIIEPATVIKIFATALLVLVFFVGIYYFAGDTNPSSDESDQNVRSNTTSYRSSKNKRSANESFRLMMLEKEKSLHKKHDRSRNKKRVKDKPNSSDAHRKWLDQKYQAERALNKFKNDQTKNPNSVKNQMIKTIQRLEEDKPNG